MIDIALEIAGLPVRFCLGRQPLSLQNTRSWHAISTMAGAQTAASIL
jgi:hypothetical protein